MRVSSFPPHILAIHLTYLSTSWLLQLLNGTTDCTMLTSCQTMISKPILIEWGHTVVLLRHFHIIIFLYPQKTLCVLRQFIFIYSIRKHTDYTETYRIWIFYENLQYSHVKLNPDEFIQRYRFFIAHSFNDNVKFFHMS